MRSWGLLCSLLSLGLSLQVARAQETVAPATPEAVPVAAPLAPSAAASDPAPQTPSETAPTQAHAMLLPASDEPNAEQLDKVRELYEVARKALGAEHVLLSATAYLGKRCAKGWFKGCDKDLHAGVAGLISVPLLGAGGGHGGDWYPVLQTEDSARAFARFQRQVQEYVALADGIDSLSEPKARKLARALEKAAKALIDQAADDDPQRWEVVLAARKCFAKVAELREQGRDEVRTSDEKPLAAVDAREAEQRMVKWTESLDQWSSNLFFEEGQKGSRIILDKCQPLLVAIASKNVFREQLKALRDLLVTYWRELADAPPKGDTDVADRDDRDDRDVVAIDPSVGTDRVTRRHPFLLGPAVGIPVTESPGKTLLLGALMEVQIPRFVRFGLSYGVQVEYDHVFGPPGWFTGLALSGELGDDLFHLLNGGLSAARSVTKQP